MVAQPTVKLDWTQVNVLGATFETVQTAFNPRAASFSDGRYIIVYTIRTAVANARVYGKIFNADGTSGPEFDVDPDLNDSSVTSSPTVAVFPDDTYALLINFI